MKKYIFMATVMLISFTQQANAFNGPMDVVKACERLAEIGETYNTDEKWKKIMSKPSVNQYVSILIKIVETGGLKTKLCRSLKNDLD